jgi:peptide deformylase
MANKLVLHGHSALTTVCSAVSPTSLNSEELLLLLSEMYCEMVRYNGIGLAANQIGRQERIFVMRDSSRPCGYTCHINPEILELSDVCELQNEGCLSLPGVSSNTPRYNKVRFKWIDETWTPQEATLEGYKAYIVQHELDHLNGRLYIDLFKSLKKQMLLDKHKKHLRRSAKISRS